MDNVFALAAFLWIAWNLGFLAFPSKEQDHFEIHFMRVGLGIAVVLVLGPILNLLHVPLDIRVFLVLATLVWGVRMFLDRKVSPVPQTFKKVSRMDRTAFIGAFVLLCVFCYGAFSYAWLEDDDPWTHAAGVKYVSVEKNLNVPQGEFHYINPYPPGYDLLMGLLHQVSTSLVFTLKFFNSFIIFLGIIFFYIFAARLFQDKRKAAWATFFLICTPCYLTHFIWAHALAISLFPVVFYFFVRYGEDRRFFAASVLSLAGVFLVQPDESIKLVIMLFILALVVQRQINGVFWKFWQVFLAAAALSMVWWGGIFLKFLEKPPVLAIRAGEAATGHARQLDGEFLKAIFAPSMHGDRAVYLTETVWDVNMSEMSIDVFQGLGLAIVVLMALGLLMYVLKGRYKKVPNSAGDTVVVWWFFFILLGLSTEFLKFPFGLFPHRFWLIFAFPVSLLAAGGMSVFDGSRFKRTIFYWVVILTFLTAGITKILLNVVVWGPGIYWRSGSELRGYVLLKKDLPVNTRVFSFTDNMFVIGADMRADFWTKAYKENFSDAMSLTDRELHERLKKLEYSFVILGDRDVRRFGRETVARRVDSMGKSGLFKSIYCIGDTLWIFKVV